MKSQKNRNDRQKMRTYGFVTGAVLLLAVLTVLLCAMAGVFDFSSAGDESAHVTAPPATMAMPVVEASPDDQPDATAAVAPTPVTTPESTPTSTPEAQTWYISVISGKGGDLQPTGVVEVSDSDSVTFIIKEDEGYALKELKVDGEIVEAADTYTFEDVDADHSIYAVFRLLSQEETPVATDPQAEPNTPSSPTDIS